MNALIIYNPFAGKNKYINRLNDLRKSLLSIYDNVDTFICQNKGDINSILIKKQYSIEVLIVLGGDGTLHEVINTILINSLNYTIFYYPTGSLNDFASYFKLKIKFNDIAKIIKENNVKKIDAIKINSSYFVYASSVAKFSSCSYEEFRLKKYFKWIAYYILIVKKFFKKYDCKFLFNGKMYRNYALFFVNLNRLGGYKLYLKDNYVDDNQIYMIIIKKTFFSFLNFLLFFFFSLKNKNIEIVKGNNFQVDFLNEEEINVDGEKMNACKKINVEVIPKALKFILPIKTNKYFK